MSTTKKIIQAAAGVSSGSGGGGGGGGGYTTIDITSSSYNSVDFNPSEMTGNGGVGLSADGTKMYIQDHGGSIYQYSMSTPFDLSTISYANKSYTYTQDSYVYSTTFKGDGTKMYMVGDSNNTVYQYSLSTAWDVSTASYENKSFSFATHSSYTARVRFSEDGTKMFSFDISDYTRTIFEHALSTDWDVSTASYSNKSMPIGVAGYDIRDFYFSPSGTQVFSLDMLNDNVRQYDLTAAFDVSSGSFSNKVFSVINQATKGTGISFNPAGTKFYIYDNQSDKVHEYNTNDTWIASSGSGGGAVVQDFFSSNEYTGNGTTTTITNDVDLTSGGMVMHKRTNENINFFFGDTVRGGTKEYGFFAGGEASTGVISSFNSDGYTLTGTTGANQNNVPYNSYSFANQDHFFKVLEYTGNGTTQEIAHGLGCVPGLLFIKLSGGHWIYWHNEFLGTSKWGYGNLTNVPGTSVNVFGNNTAQVDPTSTNFTVGSDSGVNYNGWKYIVYAFGHNTSGSGGFGGGSDDVIKCGKYTGNGSTDGPEIDLGFVPQLFMFKNISSANDWFLFDSTQGLTDVDENDPYFKIKAQSQLTGSDVVQLTSSGIKITGSNHSNWNATGNEYVYMAIRKTMPTGGGGSGSSAAVDGADVFSTDLYTGNGSSRVITNGIDLDGEGGLVWIKARTYAYSSVLFDKNRGFGNYLLADQTLQQNFAGSLGWTTGTFNTNGFTLPNDTNGSINGSYNYVSWTFRNASTFFDSITYNSSSGNVTNFGSAGATVDHSLGSVPGLIIVKCTDTASTSWKVYHSGLNGGTNPEEYEIELNATGAQANSASSWYDTAPTSTQFTLGSSGDVNNSSRSYTAYLFASLDGTSKVGSYTGNGTNQTIDCGFSAGARFILIKRTDSTGDWYVWDTERGIVAGNDPHVRFNAAATEVTTDDSIDPDSSGFIVNQVSATNINVSSAKYIFYAIA